jgi:hypothetical protein
MNKEIESILALVENYKYEISNLEITLRKLRDNRFLVHFEQMGRSEDPSQTEPNWEEVFDTGKEAAEYFVLKCVERYGRSN